MKNQPWNIVGLDAVTHGRIHGRYTVDGGKLPQLVAWIRIKLGTPDWAKAATVSGPGRLIPGRGAEDRTVRHPDGFWRACGA